MQANPDSPSKQQKWPRQSQRPDPEFLSMTPQKPCSSSPGEGFQPSRKQVTLKQRSHSTRQDMRVQMPLGEHIIHIYQRGIAPLTYHWSCAETWGGRRARRGRGPALGPRGCGPRVSWGGDAVEKGPRVGGGGEGGCCHYYVRRKTGMHKRCTDERVRLKENNTK